MLSTVLTVGDTTVDTATTIPSNLSSSSEKGIHLQKKFSSWLKIFLKYCSHDDGQLWRVLPRAPAKILNLSHYVGSTQVLHGDRNTHFQIPFASLDCKYFLPLSIHENTCLGLSHGKKLSAFWLISYFITCPHTSFSLIGLVSHCP